MQFKLRQKKVFMFSLILSMLLIGKLTTVANAAGLLTPKDRSLPELDIKDHHVQVVLEDGYAITTVDQIFYNPHDSDLEAIYSFPVPDKAAMSEFTMWIDGKPIQGEVLEKKKAREVYEDQKKQGKNAGLTEKDVIRHLKQVFTLSALIKKPGFVSVIFNLRQLIWAWGNTPIL